MQNIYYNYQEVNITPQEKVSLGGYANRKELSGKVHMEITSRALVLSDGHEKICIITNDLVGTPVSIVDALVSSVSKRTGLAANRIFYHNIHTHSAPIVQRNFSSANECYTNDFIKKVTDNTVQTIQKPLVGVKLSTGEGICDIGANRRQIDKKTGLALKTANLSGLNDQRVNCLQLQDESGKPLVIIINYACHPVVLGYASNWVSPDFPGVARREIEKTFNCHCIFLNGAAGDINPVNDNKKDPAEVENVGIKLANTVRKIVFSPVKDGSGFKISGCTINLPFRDQVLTKTFIKSEIKRKHNENTEFLDWHQSLEEWGEKMITGIENNNLSASQEVRLAAINIGNILFCFTQGELFIKYQLALKKTFSDRRLFFCGYTGGTIGYIPTSDEFKYKGYETDQAYIFEHQPSPLTPEVEAIFLQNCKSLIEEIV